MYLILGKSISLGALDTITLYYQGTPKPGGLGTFVQDTIPNGDTMIWTLSQPYGASEWWPCKDDLADKADSIDIKVSTPLRYKVATNGLLQSIDTSASEHTYHYQSQYPISTYLVAIAVGTYQVFEEKYEVGSDSLLIEHYLFPNETLNESNNALHPFLQLFDSLFGTYPFIDEKYGHASFTRGGGMEHQTMSFMGGYGGELVAHELAHQWFGDKVTCASWQDLWLNEGFATYITGLTYQFDVIHDSFYWPVVLDLWKNSAFQYPNDAVFREDTSNVNELFNAMAYQKGAYLLHMLRWVCGDSAFFAGIKNYINDPNLSFSFAKTADLQFHLEQSSSKNLDEMMKDWFYGKGYPTYTTTWAQENGTLNIEIEQISSDPSVYFFNIPAPYQLHSGNWDSTIVLNPRFSGDQFSIQINREIDSIQFDPEKWILAKSDVISSLSAIGSIDQAIQRLYPNPVQEILYLDQLQIENDFDLINEEGKLIRRYSTQDQIQVDFLPPGLYFIRWSSTQEMKQLPFIKQ